MRALIADASPATAWRWGDYLLQPSQRRLLRAGAAVELEDRAFDLIVLLLEHRERALDRQEVITEIWGKRPVSDATLRQLVYKARRAIGDDGEQQQVIHTLYGRSLQWVAPVAMVFESEDDLQAPAPATEPAVGDEVQATPIKRRLVRPRMRAAAAVVLALIAAGAIWLYARKGGQPIAGSTLPRVAIEPIENATGDASLDWIGNGLPGLLGSLLEQAGGLDVVDPAEAAHAWQFTPAKGRDQKQQLRFVTNADVLIGGRLRKLAENLYELDLRVDSGSGGSGEIIVSGGQPGLVAADAVQRIRNQLGISEPLRKPSHFLRDPLLMQAFARGVDLDARGEDSNALNYFKLCTEEAPAFLPCRYYLGRAQQLANDAPGSQRTLKTLLDAAVKQGDSRITARTLNLLARNARISSGSAAALDYARRAVPYARRAQDYETEIEAQLLSAVSAHTLGENALASEYLKSGVALLAEHPKFRRAQAMLADARHSIALDDGDFATALKTAQESLALHEADGDERGSVVALSNIATTLAMAQREGEAITLQARAMERARAGNYDELEAFNVANLAISLLNVGLPEQGIRMADRFDQLARHQGSVTNRILAAQLRASAQLQSLNGSAALASLQQADNLAGWDAQDAEVVFNQWLYEAMAAFPERLDVLHSLKKRIDAFSSGHEVPSEIRNRVLLVDALADSADGRQMAAIRSLRAAAAMKSVFSDTDLELRMAPLLVAVHSRDPAGAAVALNGYDPVHTTDASLLRLYMQWMRQTGDAAAAQRAQTRLTQLREGGLQALAAAGLSPDHLAN